MLSDTEIKALLMECVDKQHRAPGIVVGLIDGDNRTVIAYGKRENGKDTPVDRDTIFEIGSITKVFTASLLQEMADRGEVALSDPISTYLPKSVKAPSRNGKEITLLHLTTQHSGLPRLPGNLEVKDMSNPYGGYTVEKMYQFLSSYELPRDPGENYEYSNLGVGLLGHLLALKAGTNYGSLIVSRICAPLKMNDTWVTLPAQLKDHQASGHSPTGIPVRGWDLATLGAAGALRSSANDMLKFLAANMGLEQTPISSSLEKTHVARESAGGAQKIGMGWHIDTANDLVWHNGGTGGFHSYTAFNKEKHKGVVVLANSGNDIDDIGQRILGARGGLSTIKAPKQRKVATIDFNLYDNYVGEYQLGPRAKFTITRDGNRLLVALTGQQTFEVFPESETDFFYRGVPAELTFERDEQGRAKAVVLHQNGRDQRAPKIK